LFLTVLSLDLSIVLPSIRALVVTSMSQSRTQDKRKEGTPVTNSYKIYSIAQLNKEKRHYKKIKTIIDKEIESIYSFH
jgi:Na+-transporting NADH:ubiquinone oxidoreductase subunit NqrC